jgi:AraC-like DNA-binding protein
MTQHTSICNSGEAPPPGLLVSTLESAPFRVVRLRSEGGGASIVAKPPAGDTYVVAVKLRALDEHDLFLSGRHVSRTPVAAGGLCMIEPETEIHLELRAPFDILQFHFQLSMLADSLDGGNGRGILALRAPPAGTPDPMAERLARALLPALEQPQLASPLFVSHMAMAFGAHVLHTYGAAPPESARRGGLARWQEQRVKELLAANLDGAISMGELARVCGMTPSHLSTAFRQSTGVSPTGWLAQLRIAKACELLRHTALSLAEVAVASGYADQAHFSRSFAQRIGVPPGAWRRQRDRL